jgi:predicted aspartyl protease
MDLVFSARIRQRFTTARCLAIIATFAAAAAARSPVSLDALHRDGYGSVELIKGGPNQLYVPAEINGKKIRLLLDTGWGSDGITIAVIRRSSGSR